MSGIRQFLKRIQNECSVVIPKIMFRTSIRHKVNEGVKKNPEYKNTVWYSNSQHCLYHINWCCILDRSAYDKRATVLKLIHVYVFYVSTWLQVSVIHNLIQCKCVYLAVDPRTSSCQEKEEAAEKVLTVWVWGSGGSGGTWCELSFLAQA